MLNCVWWSHNMDRCNTATVGIGMWTGETQNCVSILVLTKGQISGWFSDFANLRVLLVFRNLSNESYIEVKIVFQYNCTLRPRGEVILTLAIYSCCTMLGTVVLYWMQIYISFVFTTCLDNQLATKWANIHCQFEWQSAAFRRQLHVWLVFTAEDCSIGTVWLHYICYTSMHCAQDSAWITTLAFSVFVRDNFVSKPVDSDSKSRKLFDSGFRHGYLHSADSFDDVRWVGWAAAGLKLISPASSHLLIPKLHASSLLQRPANNNTVY